MKRLPLTLLALLSCGGPAPESPDATASTGLLQRSARAALQGQPTPRLHRLPSGAMRLQGADLDARLATAPARLGPLLGLARTEGIALERLHRLPGGGALARFSATVEGLPVVDSRLSVLVDAEGEVHAWSADPGLGALSPNLKDRGTRLGPDAALRGAAQALDAPLGQLGRASLRPDGWFTLPAPAVLAHPARLRQVAFPQGATLVRAWQVELELATQPGGDGTLWELLIADGSGAPLRARLLTHDFEYRVWADSTGDLRPKDSPLEDTTPHPTGTPDGMAPEATDSELLEIDPFNSNPDGEADPWLADDATQTNGNNVDAYADWYEPDGFSSGDIRAEVTSAGVFDHSYDTTLEPTDDETQTSAAIVQAFVTTNWLHDWFYDSGFDESAGNAQLDNMGRGGEEGDPILVQVQDRVFDGKRNNANMSTPTDGESPRMQIYVWSGRSSESLTIDPAGLSPAVEVAAFGPDNFSTTAEVLEAGTDSTVCTGLDAEVTGAVVLVDRGDCAFQQKALTVEAAGGVGMILIDNNVGGSAPSMAAASGLSDPIIPSLSVSLTDGEAIRAEVAAGATTATLSRTSDPEVDGALDNTVVAHEWGHYMLGRLMGCGSTQCNGINEGWADFTALHMLLREGEDLDALYTPASYAAAGISEDAVYYGTRRVPYTRDPSKNALSFRHITEGEPLPSGHPMASDSSSNAESHNVGEIWATTLFDAYLALQEAGPDQGRSFDEVQRRMGDLMVLGLELAPSDPTFLELRDALLAAAAIDSPEDAATIAVAFAGRGMGSCASGPDSSSTDLSGVVEDTDLHPRIELTAPTFDDGLVSCDEDGVLDGGELGQITLTVSNMGAAYMVGATVELAFDPEPAGLDLPDGATVELPEIPPFTSAEVALPVLLERGAAAYGATILTATVRDANACEIEVAWSTWGQAEADLQAATETLEEFDIDDGVWTVEGDTDAEIWGRVVEIVDAGEIESAWLGVDVSGVTDSRLISPAFTAAEGEDLQIELRHLYSFEVSEETWWDGGVIELSVEGGDWTDLSEWVDPGYGGVLGNTADNPLADRSAFVGTNAAWPEADTAVFDLGQALAGQSVRLSFRVGTDQAVSDHGWEIQAVGLNGIAAPVFSAWAPDETECNPAPTADAGPDQEVMSGDPVELDGSASSDPTGEALSFTWTALSEGAEDLAPLDPAGAAFTAPTVTEATTITLQLEVSDGDATATDEVEISVLPWPVDDLDDTGDGGEDDGTGETPEPDTTPEGKGGCACASGGAPSAPFALLLLALPLLRRRRGR